jgi:hypothetical protein
MGELVSVNQLGQGYCLSVSIARQCHELTEGDF